MIKTKRMLTARLAEKFKGLENLSASAAKTLLKSENFSDRLPSCTGSLTSRMILLSAYDGIGLYLIAHKADGVTRYSFKLRLTTSR